MILSIVCLSWCLSGCSTTQTVVKTEYVISVPEKIAAPETPKFEVLDAKKSISDISNLKKLMNNLSMLKNYTSELRDVIRYYESEIDRLNAEAKK